MSTNRHIPKKLLDAHNMKYTKEDMDILLANLQAPQNINCIPSSEEWKVSCGRLVIDGQVMPIVAPDTAGYDEAQANNHLISAAKELQVMLARLLDEVMMDESIFSKIAPLTLEQSQKAIAKSMGETPCATN